MFELTWNLYSNENRIYYKCRSISSYWDNQWQMHQLAGWLLEFYVLATSKVISGRGFDWYRDLHLSNNRVHNQDTYRFMAVCIHWWFYSADPQWYHWGSTILYPVNDSVTLSTFYFVHFCRVKGWREVGFGDHEKALQTCDKVDNMRFQRCWSLYPSGH